MISNFCPSALWDNKVYCLNCPVCAVMLRWPKGRPPWDGQNRPLKTCYRGMWIIVRRGQWVLGVSRETTAITLITYLNQGLGIWQRFRVISWNNLSIGENSYLVGQISSYRASGFCHSPLSSLPHVLIPFPSSTYTPLPCPIYSRIIAMEIFHKYVITFVLFPLLISLLLIWLLGQLHKQPEE